MFHQVTIKQTATFAKPNAEALAAEIQDGVVSGISAFAVIVCFIAVFATANVLTNGATSQLLLDESTTILCAFAGLLYCLGGATAAVRFAMTNKFKSLIALGLVSAAVTGVLLAVIA
ncbi:MAG: hypothetical protein K2X77_17715 [Candidatus Obscuribacterales bacterium]|nr:hypothetical protein [Candidatus Obscuribacterales bacterium]